MYNEQKCGFITDYMKNDRYCKKCTRLKIEFSKLNSIYHVTIYTSDKRKFYMDFHFPTDRAIGNIAKDYMSVEKDIGSLEAIGKAIKYNTTVDEF